jgi:prephenate dehydrogenase
MANTRITLVGCGRTGTMLGKSIKHHLNDVELIAHDKDREAARAAVAAGAADKEEWNLPKACDGAALVLISIPGDGLELTMQSIGRDVAENGIVFVVGGSTDRAATLGKRHLPESIAALAGTIVQHPMRAGIDAGPAESLKGAVWSIAGVGSDAQIGSFSAFVTALGAQPVFVDGVERDGMGLSVDVLPALLDSLLLLTVSEDDAWRERQWSAGSRFAEAIAGVDRAHAEAGTLLANKTVIAHWLNQFMLQAMTLRDAIEDGNADVVNARLTAAVDRRDAWLAAWEKGRDNGAQPVDNTGRSVMGLFLGQRLADQLAGKRGGKQ